MKKLLAMLAVAAALCVSADRVQAQAGGGGGGGGGRGGRGFDPAQFQQRRLDNAKTDLGFTNDTEWSAVEPLVQKVLDAQREAFRGMFRRNRGGQGGDNGGAPASTGNTERDALQQAVDQNAPSAQIKAALDKYRTSQKTKQANLEQAENNLRQVLSQKQEAEAVLTGLLN